MRAVFTDGARHLFEGTTMKQQSFSKELVLDESVPISHVTKSDPKDRGICTMPCVGQ